MSRTMIGKTLRHRYKIIQQLGAGGFGETFLAEDLDIPVTPKPKCVVKRLQPQMMHPDIQRLFQKEAETLYRLGQDHDQIPKLYAYFEENGEFYLIQELIDGHDLTKELTPGKQLSENYVIKLLPDVLEILAFVHQRNVIHRDIKSANIMRRKRDGKLVLIDFGTVKEVGTTLVNTPGLTTRTIAIGTPGYMPSEQALGKPKLSSDIYALGMTAIQALTGIQPHQLPEDNDGEVIWRDRVAVSDSLADILTKMVRYDFRHRYASVTEVLQALPGSVTPIYTTAPSPPPPPPAPNLYTTTASQSSVTAPTGSSAKIAQWVTAGIAGFLVILGIIALVASASFNQAKQSEAKNTIASQDTKQDATSQVRRDQLNADIRAREQRNKAGGNEQERATGDLQSEVRSKLEANLTGSQLNVDATEDGVITVTGTIPKEADKVKVASLAKQIKGVKSVNADKVTMAAATNKDGGNKAPDASKPSPDTTKKSP
ncbi:MAG: protein kinase [Aphanothece sp. CMT-3BRIN-NPC111]|nr:protein kinase [Aphanothece sp. CMT-3BRIN-NPC111]